MTSMGLKRRMRGRVGPVVLATALGFAAGVGAADAAPAPPRFAPGETLEAPEGHAILTWTFERAYQPNNVDDDLLVNGAS